MHNFTTLTISKLDNGWVLAYSFAGETDEQGRASNISGALAFPNLRVLTNWILKESTEPHAERIHAVIADDAKVEK